MIPTVVSVTSGLGTATTVDDVARAALTGLRREPGVVRTAIAVVRDAGRRLEFVTSDRLEQSPLAWCEIDALADVPVVQAVLTGRPVVLPDLDRLRAAYPQIADRQESLGTQALVAVPVADRGRRLGALMVAYGATLPDDDTRLQVVLDAANAVAGALRQAERSADQAEPPDPQPNEPAAHRVWTLLPAGPAAPRAARAFLRRHARGWELDADVVDTAELALSELVTNAVIHAGTPTTLQLTTGDGRLLVEVTDRGTGGDITPTAADPEEVGGRGLVVVEAVTDAWGSRRQDAATTVWFELVLEDPAAQ